MDRNALDWLFSTAPQALAALVGLIFAGVASDRVTMFATGKVTNERWTCAEEGFVLVTTTNLSATLREPSLSSER